MQLEGENSHELSRLQSALNQALDAVNKVRDESAVEMALKRHQEEAAMLKAQLARQEEDRRSDERTSQEVFSNASLLVPSSLNSLHYR